MDAARQKRKDEINKSLAFIQSSLAYPEPEGYQDFLTKLVCNLLEEGNNLFREEEWEQAVREFSEGLNVSCYAAADNFHIPEVLMESLYVNRAAAYYSMGEYEQGVKDCDQALNVCKESRRALYRKALCLKELGKHREAYSCTTDCLLIYRLDEQVNELAQELAVHLGLKNRKPYISTKDELFRVCSNSGAPADHSRAPCAHLGNGLNPLSGLAPVTLPSIPEATLSSTTPVPSAVPDLDMVEDSELIGDDLDSLLDQEQTEIPTQTASTCELAVPSVLPPPTPQLPPAFFSSAVSPLNSLDLFSGAASTVTMDALDDLFSSEVGGGASTQNSGLDTLNGLDSLENLSDMNQSATAETKTELARGDKSVDGLLDDFDPLEAVTDLRGLSEDAPKPGVKDTGQLDSLDVLDSFPSVTSLTMESNGRTGTTGSHIVPAPVIQSPKNNTHSNNKERNNRSNIAVASPLSSTHEFLQACSACFPRKAPRMYAFIHKPQLVHNCKRDILLCKRKVGHPSEWTRVRPLPKIATFNGPFVLCRDMLKTGDSSLCKFGENCTFAYNQLEIDVWTEERKGKLDRSLLFETAAVKLDPVKSIIHLLQEHKGVFVFLCQECFDSKHRIMSERDKDDHTICSNVISRHTFDANKCLAFVVKSHTVTYSKVRTLSILCQMDLCRNAIRFSCQREDSCNYAHSVIELKTWRVQRDTGISPDEIVKVSSKYYETQEQSFSKGNRLYFGGGVSKPRGGREGGWESLKVNLKFVCAQCWRDGLISEPDKPLKYCTAKARHKWTKDRLVLLVSLPERSKWVQVRPLPHTKNFPMHYDICFQILDKKKCYITGNCTFAHSQEEKEMWTFMKNNNLLDMQQLYDEWLTHGHNRQTDGATLTQHIPKDKNTVMPTDNAETMSGFYCRLCGRHSNSDRQWQQHISSEKHKDRVFSCEGEEEALSWNYRFPGTRFELCPKWDYGCSDGVSCDYAHSPEELREWTERRDFLRKKLAKAREDMLIMPNEHDFGKYNFLLQD